MDTTVKFSFNYNITETTVEFNSKSYSKTEFINLQDEINPLSRSESTKVIEKNSYGADFIVVLADGQILIPAEIYCIVDLIQMNIIDKLEYTLIPFNKWFGYIVSNGYVMMIDDEKVRYGIWLINDIIKAGVPTSETPINITPNGTLTFSQNKYPHLSGKHVGMGFTKTEYKKFIQILKDTH